MPDENPPTLDFIAAQLARVLNEIGGLHDDTDVLAAIVRRLDDSQGRMVEALRSMHAQRQRIADRVRRLEQDPGE